MLSELTQFNAQMVHFFVHTCCPVFFAHLRFCTSRQIDLFSLHLAQFFFAIVATFFAHFFSKGQIFVQCITPQPLFCIFLPNFSHCWEELFTYLAKFFARFVILAFAHVVATNNKFRRITSKITTRQHCNKSEKKCKLQTDVK